MYKLNHWDIKQETKKKQKVQTNKLNNQKNIQHVLSI